MRTSRWVIVVATAAAVGAGLYFLLRPSRADLLLVNGVVYTLDHTNSVAEGVAIRGDRILATGTTEDLRRRFSAGKTIDLQGRSVIPGFVDAHAHFESLGAVLRTVNVAGMRSIGEVMTRVAAEASARGRGEWIRGRGWDQNLWPGKQFPDHEALDVAAPEHPVYLSRIDGHAAWVNRRALALAGITAATRDPDGGTIIRDASGEPTGVLVDNAMNLLLGALPPTPRAERRAAILAASAECARLGLTCVHDMGVDSLGLELYRELMSEGRLPVRLYCAIDGTGPLWDRYRERGPEIDLFDGRLTVRALKMYVDGALGSRGAALILPYSDAPDQRGLTLTGGEVLRSAAQECAAKGFQLCVHAIGDRANAIALTVFENTFNDNGLNGADLRFRIEHAQVIDPGDAVRFHRAGIIPSMQPTHCTSDMPWAQERLGPERVRTAYAWRTLLDLQNEIPAGSDAPVESPDPLLGFYAAVTRQTPGGEPAGGWFPEQRMTRDEALRAFTLWAARAAFQEKVKGSLEEGKWADLVVLSEDIMKIPADRIPRTSVLATMIGGTVVYSNGSIVPPLMETIAR
jgi:predicted amidohydrolase YtcJ